MSAPIYKFFLILFLFTYYNCTCLFADDFGIIKDDFLINDDSLGNYGYQTYPDIASNKQGELIACWLDSRTAQQKIYAQRFDSTGVAVYSNFLINNPYIYIDK